MASIIQNVARGRVRYFYDAVDSSIVLSAAGAYTSAADSAMVLVPLEATGLVADATLADYDDLAALLAGATNEQVTMGRKVFTDTELGASLQDDTNERLDLDYPDVTWTAAAGNGIAKLQNCFRPAAASADSAIVPVTAHDFAATPDGSDITAQFAATGWYRSQ